MSRILPLAACIIAASFHPSFAQADENGKSYFVVIGAFSQEKNVTDFIENWTKKFGLNPQYKLNAGRKLYYVYTMQDKYWGIPVQEADRIRKLDPKFDHTWVYYGTLDDTMPIVDIPAQNQPVTETQTITESSAAPDTTMSVVDTEPEPVAETEPDPAKKFFFELKAEDGTLLKSPIEIIDLDESKLSALYPSNEAVTIQPVNSSGRIMLQSKVFGYRLKQIGVDLNNPADSAGITLNDGVYTVPMEIKPLSVGDVTIMYNIFFFKDAGIMHPDSKYEANALVAMMQAHPNRKIVIHGHTNGNYRGKILKLGKRMDFFSILGAESTNGSAMELSEERARCIQDFLIANGIDRSRMTIKPWGGKKMLYDNEHHRAIENVRVEVEIVND